MGDTVAWLQKSRAEAGVVAVLRTEAQRMAVQDDCAERLRGRLWRDDCRRAQRQRPACCMQTHSEWTGF